MEFSHFCLPTYIADRDGDPAGYMQRLVDFLASSEDLGFDGVWANEHHFHPFGGIIPSVPIFLAALAQRTKRLRLGSSVMVLPLHHPLHVAEELAMVDLMSGGRVELGVGRGFVLYDYEVFGVPIADGQERTTEALDVILKAWSGERFSHHGKHFSFTNVQVWPAPRQRPHPPIAFACTSSLDHAVWAADRGYKLLSVAYIKPLDKLAALTRHYRQAWVASGKPKETCRVQTHFQVVVAETRKEARQVTADSLQRYTALHADAMTLSSNAELQAREAAIEDLNIDRLIDEGRLIAGTPDECVATILRARDEAGMTDLDCNFYFGGMDFDFAQRSIGLFAAEVMPANRAAEREPVASAANA